MVASRGRYARAHIFWVVVLVCFFSDLSVYSRAKVRPKNKNNVITTCSIENCQSPGQDGAVCAGPVLPASYSAFPIHVNGYGDIVESVISSSQGPTIEKVMLYSKLCSGSKKRLARSALLVRYKNAEATILLCHGFMCDKFDAGMLRSIFPRGKFNFMTFDFRAHGDSPDGQCCTLGRDEKYDVVAASRFLREHAALSGKPLIVYGFSMGAVAAIEAQAKDGSSFDAMILDCPFESTENVLRRSLDNIKFSLFGYEFSLPGRSLLQRYAFHPYIQSMVKIVLKTVAQWDPKKIDVAAYPISPAESVKKISVPVFYILCKHDEKVPIDAIKLLYHATASEYKQLWISNGRRHFDSYFYNPEQYTDRVRQFIFNYLNGKTSHSVKNEIIEDSDEYVSNCPLIKDEKIS